MNQIAVRNTGQCGELAARELFSDGGTARGIPESQDALRQSALGARYLGDNRCRFVVWAPRAATVHLRVVAPSRANLAMQRLADDYFYLEADSIPPGTQYFYVLDGKEERPDPASRSQPGGVHGPSAVIDPYFAWTDTAWHGRPLRQFILYELHVGTFSAAGTFTEIIPHLNRLQQLGVTAIELMPVAQFPGLRNWGYDGVYPFAPQDSYGAAHGLKQLVDACHAHGLAIVLDVVYNHLGPEGNYLSRFGPYFTDRYRTPWGDAINFDGPSSDHVRRYFIENALQWVRDFHFDGLRLDAVHAIFDKSARPFLSELTAAVQEAAHSLGRLVYVIEESNQNDARHLRPAEAGGLGIDGVWNDDFHHSVHALLTGERQGYYADFGRMEQLVQAYREGFAYSGQHSRFRGRHHGNSSCDVPAEHFVVSLQNHDQIGNRPQGDRLSRLVSLEHLKVAAGLMLLSPYIPLLFMGEEYGETAPFLYFVSHGDRHLIETVRCGRQSECAEFGWTDVVPDPQSTETFRRSMLNRVVLDQRSNRILWNYYRELIKLRKALPALAHLDKNSMRVTADVPARTMCVDRWHGASQVFMAFNLGEAPALIEAALPEGGWSKELDSAGSEWYGPGSAVAAQCVSPGAAAWELPPLSLVLFSRNSSTLGESPVLDRAVAL